MKSVFKSFIGSEGLSPFNRTKTQLKNNSRSIFKTREARVVERNIFASISRNFVFSDTSNLLNCFPNTSDLNVILSRQNFFKNLDKSFDNSFLKGLSLSKWPSWKPKYDIVVVTEDEKTFTELRSRNIPTRILLTERDILDLESSDIVQVINCEQYTAVLERLPQSVFLNSIEEAYLERFVEELSKWSSVINVLRLNSVPSFLSSLLSELSPILPLLEVASVEKLSREKVEDALEVIRADISVSVKEMTVSGESLIDVLSKGIVPVELKRVINESIRKTGVPEDLFLQEIPVKIDEVELEKKLRSESISGYTKVAESIRAHSRLLSSLPSKLLELESELLILDFDAGISRWVRDKVNYPVGSEELNISESENLLIDNPKPISFSLSQEHKCSILTGANSGGKTTLLEHLLQAIVVHQLGLPFTGESRLPLFSEVYYFAKNKGSMSKGAFETLLTQMSTISPGKRTLILADEIEAVTEPGVAGRMIASTVDYFLGKGCFLVVATHLGQEIKNYLPALARIDGIEAKGLDDSHELIVDHNPVLGRIANSTPELIIERMAKINDNGYFRFLHESLLKI